MLVDYSDEDLPVIKVAPIEPPTKKKVKVEKKPLEMLKSGVPIEFLKP